MDVFAFQAAERARRNAPLADRMRPRTLDEFVGQKNIVGEGRLLRRAIQSDRLSSIILYGPPGSGKTTLAQVIANTTAAHFEELNAVSSGVADVRRVVEQARERLALEDRRTVVFIDEIHRFNKGQQDALLPAVEKGVVILIGATTENPFFSINSPLLSRSRLFRLDALSDGDMAAVARQALADTERGLGNLPIDLTEEALAHLIRSAAGDARGLLNAIEMAALSTPPDDSGTIRIDLAVAEESIQQRSVLYDRNGDRHYDVISAFIKSMRGGDPDAALYWLGCMVKAGEDPRFIARRIMICAAEDVGNADPRALQVAVSAAHAVELLGMPEGRIPLAQAVVYVATAPKSNASYLGVDAAMAYIEDGGSLDVPRHLRDASYKGAHKLGHGKGYDYPHSHPGAFVPQQYLPEDYSGPRLYNPTEYGYERNIRERLLHWWGNRWK